MHHFTTNTFVRGSEIDIVDDASGYYALATYSDGEWTGDTDDADVCFRPGVVTHWQPLVGPER